MAVVFCYLFFQSVNDEEREDHNFERNLKEQKTTSALTWGPEKPACPLEPDNPFKPWINKSKR